jgi:hypothetical protein
LDSSSAVKGIDLGIVSHAENNYGTGGRTRRDYGSTLSGYFLACRQTRSTHAGA